MLIVVAMAVGPLSAQQISHLREQTERIIRNDMIGSLETVPGYLVGVIDGESEEILAFGTRDLEHGGMLSETDRFEIGSLTKVLTAHLILTLHEKQLINVHDPLNHFLPGPYRNPEVHASIMDILLHHSGLPKLPETLGNMSTDAEGPYALFTQEQLLAWYRDVQPGIRGEFRYAHTGYALLDIVIEQVTGRSFSAVLHDQFNAQLNMRCTSSDGYGSLTPGYDLAMRPVDPWQFQSFYASEAVRSCMQDLLIYMRYLLKDSSETALIWDTQRRTHDKKLQIAPGWYRFLPKKKFPVYVHTGRTSGHSVMMAFSRKTQTGVVVLANASTGTDDLALLILRMINKQWKRKGNKTSQ